MPVESLLLLLAGVFVIAVLYSTVGHAGASGYIAVMSLMGLAPAVIKPGALALNILVASIAVWQFSRAGHFSWRLFWPFALPAVPCAFIGGYIALPTYWFNVLVGLVLLLSAVRLLFEPKGERPITSPPLLFADGRWSGHWSAGGAYRHWWRHLSHAPAVAHELGSLKAGSSCFSIVHIAQFRVRAFGQLVKYTGVAVISAAAAADRRHRWPDRLISWQPQI